VNWGEHNFPDRKHVKQARVLEKTKNLVNYWLHEPTPFSSKRPHLDNIMKKDNTLSLTKKSEVLDEKVLSLFVITNIVQYKDIFV